MGAACSVQPCLFPCTPPTLVQMRDSNQFHAVCQDTYPPVFYMNDVSKRAVALVGDLTTVGISDVWD